MTVIDLLHNLTYIKNYKNSVIWGLLKISVDKVQVNIVR